MTLSFFAFWMLIAVAVIAAIAAFSNRITRTLCLLIAVALPPLIALTVVDRNAPAFGDVRLRLISSSFSREDPSPIWLGGDRSLDDIHVTGLPPQLVRIRSDGRVNAFPTRRGKPNEEGQRPAAEAGMASVSQNGASTFLGTYPLEAGDRFCVQQCAEPNATWYRIDAAGSRLRIEGSDASLPEFRTRGRSNSRPSQVIFPVRDYGRPWEGRADAQQDVCRSRFVCDASTRQPVRSFLFRDGRPQLFLALLDEDAVLETRRPEGAARLTATSAQGPVPDISSGATLTLWEVSYAGPDVDLTEAERLSSLIRRRVLNLQLDATRITLGFALQPIRVIERDDLALAAARLEQGGLDAPVVIALAGAETGTEQPGNIIHFDAIGGRLAAAIAPGSGRVGSLIFPRALTNAGASDRLLPQVGGSASVNVTRAGNQEFSIGTADQGGRSVSMAVDRLSFPMILLIIVAFWACLFGVLQFMIWRDSPAALILTLALQVMLLLRAFVSIGSAVLDPQIDLRTVLADSLIGYCLVPFAMAVLFPGSRPGRFDYAPAGVALVVISLLLAREYGASFFLLAAAIAAGVVGTFRPLGVRAWSFLFRREGALRIWRSFRHLARYGGPLSRKRTSTRRSLGSGAEAVARLLHIPRRIRGLVFLGLSLFAIRAGLYYFLQIQERIYLPDGTGIAITVVYLPAALLIVAGLFDAARHSPASGSPIWTGVWTAIVVMVLFYLAPRIVADRGFTLVYLGPLIIISAAYACARWGGWTKALWRAPAVGAIAAFAVVVGVASLSSAGRDLPQEASAETPLDREQLLTSLRTANDRRLDDWRVDAIVDSDALNEAGTTSAEQIRRWRFLLASFTASVGGRGFPYQADISDLRRVQTDDNVSAVHLIAPFGRSGAAMFILMLGAAAFGAQRVSGRGGFLPTTSVLAVWTVFGAAAYMILANMLLVPFTGRNVYFMATLSHSDLLEGAVLVAMAFVGFVRRSRGAT
ncbi:MAG TPA: hypothetical protein VEC11_08480 [Allosphingosinicella sp.]|nr:hypothetical protein [Allosphingosinicella sp.]